MLYMPSYIKNYGMVKTFMKNNKETSLKEIDWNGEYDGKEAHIQVHINDNGKEENAKIKLNKDDMMDLLNTKTVNIPLDQRLTQDFLEPLGYVGNSISKSKIKKTRRHKNKKSKKYSKKNK